MSDDVLLRVEGLKKHFPVTAGLARRQVGAVRAVDGVSFELHRGETLGLVGESGCGKTTLGRCVLRLEEPTAGRIVFEGHDLLAASRGEMKRLRRDMQIVFQDPFSSLNPRMTVLDVVGEALSVHGVARGAALETRVVELLAKVGIPRGWLNRYPHEFSGGQRQRIGVARAIALDPRLIVCDEAVSALDVSIQAQVINLLISLREEMGLAYLFIAHDLSVVRHISHRIAVMYLGQIVETASSAGLFRRPAHPYTRALLSAIPVPDPGERRPRILLAGDVPTPLHPPSGCRFHTRCPAAFERCRAEEPATVELGDGQRVKCFLYDEGAGSAVDERLEAALAAARVARTVVPPDALVAAPPVSRQRIETRAPVRPRIAWGLLGLAAFALVAGAPVTGVLLALAGAALVPPSARLGRPAILLGVGLAAAGLGWAGAGLRSLEKVGEAREQLAGLEQALAARRDATGAYPETLAELGWRLVPVFGEVRAVDPWGRPWHYRAPGEAGEDYDLGTRTPSGEPIGRPPPAP